MAEVLDPSLMSLRKIISESRSVIPRTFFSCLGQLVDILSELQFWMDRVREQSMPDRSWAA